MSWNPQPTLGGANWQGNPPLVTKNQLFSTSAGIIEKIQLSTISTFQTLTALEWISVPTLYVSDIQGYAQLISANTAQFNFVSVSSIGFKAPDIGPLVDVNVDFNLGDFVQGALIGTGALLFETAVGIGIGAGATFVGIGNGIAAMINSKDPANNTTYINTNNYEVMGGSTQLQVSTLGSAYPVYSSIMRYVSSIAPNQVAGPSVFTSTLFYPGQICVRSISDPYPLVTANPALQGSTIQQFGEWVPLEGLEPTNIDANSISTNFLSSGQAYMDLAEIISLSNYSILTNNIGVASNLSFNFMAGADFTLGGGGNAAMFGDINQWNFQTNQPIVFSQLGNPSVITPGATLTLGTGAESVLEISTINATGFIGANTGFFSSLVVNELTVLSSFSTVFTIVACNVISTSLIEANLISTVNLEAKYIAPFLFSSILGNPTGPFDINKVDNVISTSYNQVSSLTQNILNYSLSETVQNQTTWDVPIRYNVLPSAQGQWASTIMYRGDTGGNAGLLGLSYYQNWLAGPVTSGFFDLTVDMTTRPFFYYVTESSNSQNTQVSTILTLPATPGFYQTYRFSLQPTGWWTYTSPAPPPAITSNNNTFQMYQDINDTYIQGTDSLHIKAGNIYLDGTTNFQNVNIFDAFDIYASNTTTSNLFAEYAQISTLSSLTVYANNVTVNPLLGGFDSVYTKQNISWNDPPVQVTPFQAVFSNISPDFLPQFNLIAPFQGNNYFTSYNVNQWNNSVWVNSISATSGLGPPKVFVGDLQTPLGTSYSGFFYINNSVAQAMPVYVITSAGSNQLGVCPGVTYNRIQTADGITWTITTNIPNPQGSGGTFSNAMTITQGYQQTSLVNTQTLNFQAPNVTYLAGNFNMYADQIRVNSHRYGLAPATGLPSYPIGIEFGTYIDGNISWTQNPPASGIWQSDATNIIYNPFGIFFDINSWRMMIVPSRFRTNTSPIYSWDVQIAAFAVGGGGFCWGYNRYIQVASGPSGPGINTTDNWNEWIAIPLNYCTY